MKIIPVKVWRIGYAVFGKWLPASWKSSFAKHIRGRWARRIITYAGKNINIERGSEFSSNISMGDNSGLGENSVVSGPCIIGNNVMMGPEVVIYTIDHAHSRTDIPMCNQGTEDPREVVIEDDVWIGRRVIILPGVTIGKGSVIGAGAVVSKNVPPYSVAVGNPAKVVRNRCLKVDEQI